MRLAMKSKHPIKTLDLDVAGAVGQTKRQALWGYWKPQPPSLVKSTGGEHKAVQHGSLVTNEEILRSLMGRR